MNRQAFIRRYFTSKIRVATASHSPVQKQTAQIPTQVSQSSAEMLRARAGVWGQKSISQHQLPVRFSCSLPSCPHAEKQGLLPDPNLPALPCLTQLHHNQQRGPAGTKILNGQTAAQNRRCVCTAGREQSKQEQGSQAPTLGC